MPTSTNTRLIFPVFVAIIWALLPARNASAGLNLTVTASAGGTSPSPVEISQTDDTQLSADYDQYGIAAEVLASTTWQWDITEVDYSADGGTTYNVEWPANNQGSPQSSAADSNFAAWFDDSTSQTPNLMCTFQIGGYWKVWVVAAARYMDEDSSGHPIGYTWTPPSNDAETDHVSGPAITSVTVTSGATTQDVTQDANDQNWACKTQPSGSVIVTVHTAPDTDDVWQLITWGSDGGAAVAGHDNERSYTTGSSTKYGVHPSIGASSVNPLYIWVVSATIQVLTSASDTLPANASQWRRSDQDGTEILGPRTFTIGDQMWGCGKVCEVATLLPAGVGAVVTGGWTIPQQYEDHNYVDGAQSMTNWNTTWQPDGPAPGSRWAKLVPDSADKIYRDDGPIVSDYEHATMSYEHRQQCTIIVQWHAAQCSAPALWYYDGEWNAGSPQTISPNTVGVGNPMW